MVLLSVAPPVPSLGWVALAFSHNRDQPAISRIQRLDFISPVDYSIRHAMQSGAGCAIMKVEIENKVVARFRDGRIIKGYTQDFFPNKDVFHISGTERGKDLTEVLVPDLKALFFVKSFEGKKDHRKHDHPDVIQKLSKTAGIKLKIVFADGEQMLALTQGYDPSRKGFFIFSPDTESNWERAFVLKQAIKEVTRVK
jgi:hypothetical protein